MPSRQFVSYKSAYKSGDTTMMGSGYGYGMMGGMWLFPLLFWAVVIIGTIFIVRWLIQSRRSVPATNTVAPRTGAEEIIKQRYAHGEIDHDTFEQMKNDIR